MVNAPQGGCGPAEALAASELRYRRLFETAKDGILILDAESGVVVDVNPFLTGLLGFSRDEVMGKAVWELGFFRDAIASRDKFLELQRQAYVRYDNLPLETADGRRCEVEFVSNVYVAGGTKVIQCNIRDITERVRAEEGRTRLAAAVEQSAEMIVITDAAANILYANPAFEKTSGYSLAEVMGKNPRILKSGTQDAEFYRRMWETLSRGDVWHGRLVNKRKDGTFCEEDATISPVRDGRGRVANYVAAMRDVTHESRLEDQLRHAQKMESVGRLAGGVAHDFNNLMTAVMGYAEMIRDRVGFEQPIRGWVDEIMSGARRSADITRQLLAFARKQIIAPRVLDLNEAVDGMLKLLQRLIGEDISIAWRPAPNLWHVKFDPSQFDQILANLCVNARDAVAGTGRITLETSNAEIDSGYCADHAEAVPGVYVMLAVTDDGCGMDPATLANVFEPFFTTKAVGKGTGLGLATVYGIVKQNRGFINVYSEPGKGSTFRIYLPRSAERVADAGEAGAATAPRGRGETVLLVEDEKPLRVMCGLFLTAMGYDPVVAESPVHALEIARHPAKPIHVLLTDVVMPGMDGGQLAQRVCGIVPGVKVLFMSGYPADVVAGRGMLNQDAAFIAKPFARNELALKLREVLDNA